MQTALVYGYSLIPKVLEGIYFPKFKFTRWFKYSLPLTANQQEMMILMKH